MSGPLTRAARDVVWYLREVTGENDYARYVEHARATHPDDQVLDRRSFERSRQDEQASRPVSRCC